MKNSRCAYYQYIMWGLIALILVSVVAVRVRLLPMPLERDEGEFAYMGQLMLRGIPPYQLAYNMKLPGTYAAYAFIMALFGQTAAGIHLGLLLINSVTTALVFLLAKRLFNPFTGLISGASFAVLSINPMVLGLSAHATHFVLLPALGGMLVLLSAMNSGKKRYFFCSGVLLGLACVMKQQGIFFIIFSILYFLVEHFTNGKTGSRDFALQMRLLLYGAITPLAVTGVVLYSSGVFENFWFWAVTYASRYAAQESFADGLQLLLYQGAKIIRGSPVLWGIGGAGLVALCIDPAEKKNLVFTGGLVLLSFLAVCPGLYFREHYFVLMLPAAAMLIGCAVNFLYAGVSRGKERPLLQVLITILFLAAVFSDMYPLRDILCYRTPSQACRSLYRFNPFPESVEIAQYIKNHTKLSDRIAVFGSEPQIYFYSQRLSATGYIYTYPLMESHPYVSRMQQAMINDIEQAKPAYLVVVNIPTSWAVRRNSDRMVFNWMQGYIKNYTLEGVIEIISMTQTICRWNKEAFSYRPQTDNVMYILKRNTPA
jgi:hypothetical protein